MGRTTRIAILMTTTAVAIAGLAGVAGAGVPLDKKTYLREANAVCAAANEQLDAVFEQAFAGLDEDDQPSDAQIEQALGGAVPIFRQAIADVDALEGPAALDKKVGKILDEYGDVIDEVEADPLAAFDEDAPDPFAKVDKKAKKVGLKVCAQSD